MKLNSINKLFVLCLCCLCVVACNNTPVPKPRGYFRIDLPTANYQPLRLSDYPYFFDISNLSDVKQRDNNEEKYWIDIEYPSLGAAIHCSYKQVKGNNLSKLTDDAFDFVYKHAGKATAIPEVEYSNDELNVYGVFFELKGNTASPYQFFLTDSTNNFFRAAVYFNAIPNQDSLQPVIDYLYLDLIHMVESFEWNK